MWIKNHVSCTSRSQTTYLCMYQIDKQRRLKNWRQTRLETVERWSKIESKTNGPKALRSDGVRIYLRTGDTGTLESLKTIWFQRCGSHCASTSRHLEIVLQSFIIFFFQIFCYLFETISMFTFNRLYPSINSLLKFQFLLNVSKIPFLVNINFWTYQCTWRIFCSIPFNFESKYIKFFN